MRVGRRVGLLQEASEEVKTLLALCLPLTACTEPTVIEQVNWDVNHTRPYAAYTGADKRYLAPGEAGNCYAQAYTKQVELKKQGIDSTIIMCRLQDEQGHAVLMTAEGYLDNRRDGIESYAEVGCR